MAFLPRPWPVSARFQAHSSGAGHSEAYRRQDREDQAMPKARVCRAAAGAVISAGLPGASWTDPERGAWWNIRFASPLTTPAAAQSAEHGFPHLPDNPDRDRARRGVRRDRAMDLLKRHHRAGRRGRGPAVPRPVADDLVPAQVPPGDRLCVHPRHRPVPAVPAGPVSKPRRGASRRAAITTLARLALTPGGPSDRGRAVADLRRRCAYLSADIYSNFP